MPEYYKSKINVAILLAPAASMYHQDGIKSRWMSEEANMKLIAKVAEEANELNWFPHGYLTTGPELAFCSLLDGKICEYLI